MVLGIMAYKKGCKLSYLLTGLSVALFYTGVIYFMKSELGLDIGKVESKVLYLL